jgi:diguanylate cyclase (GGDEF)-like protein
MKVSTFLLRAQGLVLAVLGVVGISLLLGLNRVQQDVRAVEHLREQDRQVEAIVKHVVDLETGVRGFVITKDVFFLAPYTVARARLTPEFAALRTLLASDPDSAGRQVWRLAQVGAVQALLTRWYTEAAQPDIAERRSLEGQVVGQALIGKTYIDQIRAAFSSLQDDLHADLLRRQASSEATLRVVQWITWLGLPLLMLTFVLVGLYLTRQLSGAFWGLQAATRRLAGGDLTGRAPDLHLSEAQALAHDFNRMALALQGAQADVGAQNVRLTTQNHLTSRLSRDAARLAELSDNLQACYTLEEGYAVLGRGLPNLFPGWSGAVAVIAASRNLMDLRVAWGEDGWRIARPSSTPDQCWALRRGAPYTLDSPLSMPCLQQSPGSQQPYLCIPLLAQGESVGTLRISGDTPDLEQAEILLVRTFALNVAKQVALAIANLQLRDTLRHQSIRDPLTRLFNRRYLEETLSRELRRAERRGGGLSVLAIDIDHFKRFNDSFGHDGGDAALVAVAETMRSFFRAEDVVCRYGGEEFMVVLDMPHELALERAEALRQAVRALHLTHHGAALGTVTISLGVATSGSGPVVAERLIAQADAALYGAKHAGRDRVVGAEPVSA